MVLELIMYCLQLVLEERTEIRDLLPQHSLLLKRVSASLRVSC